MPQNLYKYLKFIADIFDSVQWFNESYDIYLIIFMIFFLVLAFVLAIFAFGLFSRLCNNMKIIHLLLFVLLTLISTILYIPILGNTVYGYYIYIYISF